MTTTRQQRGVRTSVLNVRIQEELVDWLREFARREGISLNMAAAQAIQHYQDSTVNRKSL